MSEKLGKDTYTATVAYTTPSGRMHLGHGLGHIYADTVSKYESLANDSDIFFPMGIHSTGKDLIKIIDKLSSKDEKKQIYERYGITSELSEKILSEETLEKSVDSLVEFFKNKYYDDLDNIGVDIDKDSFFSSHQAANQKYTQWTLKKLNEQGLIVDTHTPRYYCPSCDDIKAIESDFSEVSPLEKPNLENLNISEGYFILFEGDQSFVPVYTTKPETVFSATNIFKNENEINYSSILLNNYKKPLTIEESSIDQLVDLLGGKENVKSIKKLGGFKNEKFKNPITGDTVPITNSNLVKENNGTGFVMAVPAHDPYDYFYLQKNNPELLKDLKFVVFNEEDRPITFDSDEVNEENLENLRDTTYKLQEKGMIKTSNEKYNNRSVKETRDLLLEDLVDRNMGGEFLKIDGGKFACKLDDSRIIAKRTKENAIDYSNEKVQNKVINHVEDMKINPETYREELKNYVRTRKPKPFERNKERNIGAISPFNKDKRVEALSDSNIYMEFYPISKLINQGFINEDSLSDEFFDYIFLDKGSPIELSKSLNIESSKLEEAKIFVESLYPLDLNVAATEHKDVHFPFSLFTHGAVLPDKYFPKEYLLTSLITLDGEKMSKSKGNVVYLDDLIDNVKSNFNIEGLSQEASLDSIRFFVTNYQSVDRDFDWNYDTFEKSGLKQFKNFAKNKLKQLEKISSTNSKDFDPEPYDSLDKWILTKKQKSVKKVNEFMRKRDLRKSSIEIFNNMEKAFNFYQANSEEFNPTVANDFIKTQLEMSYPFTPRFSNEIFQKKFNSNIESWPDIERDKSFIEEYEKVESSFDPKYLKKQIGKVNAEVGKMKGKKNIKEGDEIKILVPSNFTKDLILNSNIKQLNNFKVSFKVDETLEEISVERNK